MDGRGKGVERMQAWVEDGRRGEEKDEDKEQMGRWISGRSRKERGGEVKGRG